MINKEELIEKIINISDLNNDEKAEIIGCLRKTKKFGIVWEDEPEEVQENLRKVIPLLKEDECKRIISEDIDAPNHVLIESDNLEAITALTYSHEGAFDAIYIDPPYNSGARDWRYNNDYIDINNNYRHSKWLAMMNHRLIIAKKLLNPDKSVLIVTIDEKEYHHLGCLLEEVFPEGRIQMISTVINVKGVARENEFSRVNEYIYIVQIGSSKVEQLPLGEEWLGNVRSSGRDKVRLGSMLRSGSNSERKHSPGCFYPIYFTPEGKYVKTGNPIALDVDRTTVPIPDGLIAVWPIHTNGSEGVWQYGKDGFEKLVSEGYVYFGSLKNGRIGISYAPKGVQAKIKAGLFTLNGYDESGSAIIDDTSYESTFIPGNQWAIPSHNATEYGSKLLKDMFGDKVFPYPKSIYAVHDTLRFFVNSNKNAKILDFFAGSGTTLHATMILNSEDDGHRQCFLVTNNENNICENVTYERCKKVINGYKNQKGEKVLGLKNNNLRFYQINYVAREASHQVKKEQAYAMKDLLCIKENVYDENYVFGNLSLNGKEKLIRYFSNDSKKMLLIYDSRVIPFVVREIALMDEENLNIKIYIFADGSYPYTADFEAVLNKITLVAMPYAMNKALRTVLPEIRDIELNNELESEEE